MTSKISKTVSIVGVVFSFQLDASALASESVVVGGERVAPPTVEGSKPQNESGVYLGAWIGCTGRNNRGTKISVRGQDPNTFLYTEFDFRVQDTSSGTITPQFYRIRRPAPSIRAQESPFFSCTKMPPQSLITSSGWNGKTCNNTSTGQNACKWSTDNNVTTAQRYVCTGGAHEGGANPSAHDCVFHANGSITCNHSPQGGESHIGCRRVRDATLSGLLSQRYSAAQIECKHRSSSVFTPVLERKLSTTSEYTAVPVNDYDVEVAQTGVAIIKLKTLPLTSRIVKNSLATRSKQVVPPNTGSNCAFNGCTGEPDKTSEWKQEYARGIKVGFTHPGADGFCGGFHSPLMLFFKGERLPSFQGESRFQMGKPDQRYSWPEPNAHGWFLAQNPARDRKINNESQLFGSNDPGSNGFEALASFDANQDGVIDSRDSIFSTLVLWNDRNSDSISQPAEVKTLPEMGVLSISLKYDAHHTLEIGDRAEAKQKSSFTYRSKKSKTTQQGLVLDIWFRELAAP
jgi:hypothetical protein